MHTLLILASLFFSFTCCALCVLLLRSPRATSGRRTLQVTGLFVPALLLGLLAAAMTHFITQTCFIAAPPADVIIAEALSVIGAAGIMVAITLNLARAFILPMSLRSRTWDAPEWLQARTDYLAGVVGVLNAPVTKIAVDARPWALVVGIFRPRVVVSTGLIALLDREELDAVLCHELLHIRGGDLMWTLTMGVLRDLTWYLPATRRLYREMLIEQELACDDRVPGESRRLALAGALARVWQAQGSPGRTLSGALGLLSTEHGSRIEMRVRRILDHPAPTGILEPRRCSALLAPGLLLGFFISAQIGSVLLSMNSMGCGMQDLFSAMPR